MSSIKVRYMVTFYYIAYKMNDKLTLKRINLLCLFRDNNIFWKLHNRHVQLLCDIYEYYNHKEHIKYIILSNDEN